MDKIVIPGGEILKKYTDSNEKRGKPVYGVTPNGQYIWFFSSAKGLGEKLDTAADIPVSIPFNDDQLIIQNAELALFFYQLYFTGNQDTKLGDLEWFKKINSVKLDQDLSYAFKQSLGYMPINMLKSAFGISQELSLVETIKKINSSLESCGSQMRILDTLDKVPIECKCAFGSINCFTIKGKQVDDCVRFYSIISGFIKTRRGVVSFPKVNLELWDSIKGNAMGLVLMRRASEEYVWNLNEEFPINSIFMHYAPYDLFFGMDIIEIDGELVIKGEDFQGKYLTQIAELSPLSIKKMIGALEEHIQFVIKN